MTPPIQDKKRNTLTNAQVHKLYTHLSRYKPTDLAFTTSEEIARDATTQLGFPVNARNIDGARADLNLPYKKQTKHDPSKATLILATHLAQLIAELGKPVPDDLKELLP